MPDFTDKLKPAEPSGPSLLEGERARSSVKVKELASHLFSSNDFLERQAKVLRVMQKEPLLSKKQQSHLARPERYRLSLARSKLLRRLTVREGWSLEEFLMAEYLVDEMNPYTLHMSMFNTTVREQGSEEQQRHWRPLIDKWEIIGAYGQSELGHGSNVRGLETTATYDPRAREFVIHSPTLTASKWWNGSLGRTATHAIIVAQLLLPAEAQTERPAPYAQRPYADKYVSIGPHPFIMQIRDLKTHEPLNGIVVGDIGTKYGYQSMDNAYCLFDHVRIPHSAFLARFSQVDPATGRYHKPKNANVVYGSLTAMRSHIVMQARLVLARAVTVAVRYTCIRRQFQDRDQSRGPEMTVIDYPTVRIRVLPLLATTYALHYSGVAMMAMQVETRREIDAGDYSALADLHATSSGLKSLCTTLAADGIETCRRAMGGHGFHGGSGLVGLNSDYLSKPTVEGDNFMITQQCSSYLIKKVSKVLEDLKSPTATRAAPADPTEAALREYIVARRAAKRVADYIVIPHQSQRKFTQRNDAAIVAAFVHRAAALSVAAHEARMVQERGWTDMMIQLHEVSNAHSQAVLVRNFYNALYPRNGQSNIPASARPQLEACFRLYALWTMAYSPLVPPMTFVTTDIITIETMQRVPSIVQQLMEEVRPHVVSLVDGWSIPDYLLDSALGRYDGQVYETLFDLAHRQNPLNEKTVNPWYWDEEVVRGDGPYRIPDGLGEKPKAKKSRL